MTSAPHYRIVHCFRSPVGGIFRHVRDLAEAQIAAGHEVGMVLDSSTGGAYEDCLLDAIADRFALGVKRIPMQRHVGPGDAMAAMRTFNVIRRMKPDVLHGHGAKGGVYSRVFGSLLRVSGSRVARLYSPHGGSLHYDDDIWSGRMLFRIERLLERGTDHLLFVSDYERQTYLRKIGTPRCASSLVYNGVSEAEFEPVGSNDDAADFLFIGMMRDLKGPDIFVEALQTAAQKAGRRLSAVMVGDGPDRDALKQLANAPGFPADVTFRQPMPARAAFRLARIVVVPSRAEAMPYIVLEALAAGKPMIASAVGGIPEIFAKAPGALVAPDAQALAGHMAAALADEAAYMRQMPDRKALGETFSAAAMARRIDQVYRCAHGDEEPAAALERVPA